MNLHDLIISDLTQRGFCDRLLGAPRRLGNSLVPEADNVDLAIYAQRYLDVSPDRLAAQLQEIRFYVFNGDTDKEEAFYVNLPPERETWTLAEVDAARENVRQHQRGETPSNELDARGLPKEARPKHCIFI